MIAFTQFSVADGARINPDFVIPPDDPSDKKEDGNYCRVDNWRFPHLHRVPLPIDRRRRKGALFIIDSNKVVGSLEGEENHLRQFGMTLDKTVKGKLGAPTVIEISVDRFLDLLDPKKSGNPLLGHAVEQVRSGRYSIPARTLEILQLPIKPYDYWGTLINQKGRGLVTFDALSRAHSENAPVRDNLLTPPNSEAPLVVERFRRVATGKAGKSQSRIDETAWF